MAKAVKAREPAAPPTKTVAYDIAEQLRTPEEMAAYLDARALGVKFHAEAA
jgi:hypothetical protein